MDLSWGALFAAILPEALDALPPDLSPLTPHSGLVIIENPAMVESEEYEVTVPRTLRQRWIDPLLHPVALNFEPWVKTRTETRTRAVASRAIIETPDGLIMHPAMAAEVRRLARDLTQGAWPLEQFMQMTRAR